MKVGWATVELGAGRLKKGDPIDHAVGVVFEAKVGNRVKEGDVLFTIHANDASRLEVARKRLLAAYSWTEEDVKAPPLVYEVIQ
jgi:pyrimidine-nucleoside phosphorylase